MTATTSPAQSGAPAAARVVLRPGTHVLRRSATELQVGLDPRRALVLPDRPEVRALLEQLARPAAVLPHEPDEVADSTLEALAAGDLLMDLDVLLPLMPAPPRHEGSEVTRSVSRAGVAALAAEAGDPAATLLAHRSRQRVDVLTCGSAEAVPVAEAVVGMLSAAGIGAHRLPHGRFPVAVERPSTSTQQPVGLLVAVGEPPREHLDGWMRTATPHLLLRLTEGHAVVGPFVRPGESACLRCVDAHHTDVDPAWPLLLVQYASAVARARDDTVPEPVDPLLATLAGAWAAQDLVSYAEGRSPVTTAATVRLEPRLTALETQRWPRHPACGCSWDEGQGSSCP